MKRKTLFTLFSLLIGAALLLAACAPQPQASQPAATEAPPAQVTRLPSPPKRRPPAVRPSP